MDDFGVLVQNYGIKPQGKLAPMASTKGGIRTQNSNSFHLDPAFSSRPSSRSSKSTHNWNSSNGSNLDDQADPFGFNFNGKAHNYGGLDGFDDVFQVPVKSSGPSNSGGNGGTMGFDLESMFMDSMNLNTRSGKNDRCGNEDYSDMFGGFSTSNAPMSVENNDLLSSTPPGGDPIDDFFGNLRTTSFESRGSRENLDGNKGKVLDSDDMLPGFSSSNGRNERGQAATRLKKSVLSSIEELEDFATRMVPENANSHEDNYLEKDIFEFENKIKKRPNNNFQEINFMYIDEPDTKPTTAKKHNNSTGTVLDLDSFFNSHNQTKATSAGKDAASDIEKPEVVSSKTRPEAVPNLFFDGDDLSSIFGAGFSCGEFEEIEGESEERRAARLDRHRRTEKRMAQALADMNERELQAQQEQEERHRIAEALNIKMKSWAAGKEGNLRALLSSLQQVLDPECGWKPVSLTDLITSAQVKIVYKKAALFVHPDKVQQRGASLQQKYVAEKVFDILKEAWNKFNADELR